MEHLDGDAVRKKLCRDLGFSASFIAPYRHMREYCRAEIGRFVEVYVKCSLNVLIQRDERGFTRRALAGEISGFTGIRSLRRAGEPRYWWRPAGRRRWRAWPG